MKKNVVVKLLFIYVGSSDQSYTPQELVVSVGRKTSLKEIKELRVPANLTGPFLVVENLKVYYPGVFCRNVYSLQYLITCTFSPVPDYLYLITYTCLPVPDYLYMITCT